ncbi:cytochrome c [Lentisphaera marina]|uniref:c-type cytochrome n=1 Tax=Lentisphaera marina TaxID=1111041 RepID=UPI0023672EBB|nr:cytochrome c [Lentisphaera marina]MDD7986209.1 cytochrome c [Lentisphaera marina]
MQLKNILNLVLIFSSSLLLKADDLSELRGQKLYETICFSCHGNKLEGATGPNLKDYEWLHGSSKSDIIKSITNGFPEKGMLAFGALYKQEQINDLVNFILSRQQGLRNVEYKIFHDIQLNDKFEWDKHKADKQRSLKPPHFNPNLPEVNQFAISFKGQLLIPKHLAGDFILSGIRKQYRGIALYIDGDKIPFPTNKDRAIKIPLNLRAGTHDIRLEYIKDFKSTVFFLDLVGKETIPLTSESYRRSITSSHIPKAENAFLINRKRITAAPPGSIIVNHMDKISYAIDPKTSDIKAMWLGKSLDIGPNIYARGQHFAQPIGTHLFSAEQSINLFINGKAAELKYIGYSDKPLPKFIFKSSEGEISLQSKIENNALKLSYSIKSNHALDINLKIPQELNTKLSKGKTKNGLFTPESPQDFFISIPIKELK